MKKLLILGIFVLLGVGLVFPQATNDAFDEAKTKRPTDFFIDLIYNENDIVGGEARYILKNPLTVPINLKETLDFYIAEQTKNNDIYYFKTGVLKNITTNTTVHYTECDDVYTPYSYYKNGSVANYTYKAINCMEKVRIEKKTEEVLTNAPETLNPGDSIIITIRAKWKARTGFRLEWVPRLKIYNAVKDDSVTLSNKEWAWWNASMSYSVEFSYTTTNGGSGKTMVKLNASGDTDGTFDIGSCSAGQDAWTTCDFDANGICRLWVYYNDCNEYAVVDVTNTTRQAVNVVSGDMGNYSVRSGGTLYNSSLALWYSAERSDVLDMSSYENDPSHATGTVSNTSSDCVHGDCVDCNTGGVIWDNTASIMNAGEKTICVWANFDSLGANERVFDYSNGGNGLMGIVGADPYGNYMGFQILGSGTGSGIGGSGWEAIYSDDQISTSSTDFWCFQYSAIHGWIKIFLNGDVVGSDESLGVTVGDSSSELNLGCRAVIDDSCADVTFDDFMIYNYALSEDEINDLYSFSPSTSFVNSNANPPSITLSAPTNTTYEYIYGGNNLSLTYTVSDIDDDINSCYWINATGVNTSIPNCNNLTMKLGIGSYTVSVYVVDDTGYFDMASINFSVQDTADPDVSINAPTNTTYEFIYGGNNLSVNYVANDTSGLSACYLINSSGGNITLANCVNTTTKVGLGTHTIKIIAVDNHGLVNDDSVTFSIQDTATPDLTINSPINDTYTYPQGNGGTNISINYVANDTAGLGNCYLINATGDNITLSSCQNTTMEVTEGYYNIKIIATDTSGNVEDETIYFTVKASIITLNVTSPTNTTYADTNISLTYMTTSGDECWYKLDSDSNFTLSSCQNTTFLANEGHHTLIVVASNTSLNTSISTTIYFSVRIAGILDDCSLNSLTALNLTFYDEKGLNLTVGRMEIVLQYWAIGNSSLIQNVSYTFTNDTNFSICIFSSASVSSNVTIIYDSFADTHSQREYYIVNATLSNQTQQINLYLLDDDPDISIVTNFFVENAFGSPAGDVIIKFQRWYPGTNTYNTVSMIKTNIEGYGVTFLEPYNALYKFIAERGGVVLDSWSPDKIVPDPVTNEETITRKLTGETLGEIYNYMNHVFAYCSYNNATTVLRCEVTDTTGLTTQSKFKVERLNVLSWTSVYEETQTSSGVTYTYTIGNTTNNTYKYSVVIFGNDGQLTLVSDTLDFPSGMLYFGTWGLFTSFMLFLVFIMVGLPKPEIALGLATLSLVISAFLGFFEVGLSSLVSIIVVIAIAIWRYGGRYG